MWFTKSAVKELEAPRPGTVRLGEEDAVLDEWLAIQYACGIKSAATGQIELARFCRDELITIFSTQDVFDYLCKMADTSKTKWSTYPLREVDWAEYKANSLHAAVRTWPKQCQAADRCYRGNVPIPVLLTIQKFQQKFGDEVHFYILALSQGDPFLAVTMRDSVMLIVERWDEPGFRGAK